MATELAIGRSGEMGMYDGATVFVVDDDPAVLRSLRWLIESVGLRVECFESASAFLDAFDADRPGCIILDVRMPGMGGLDLHDQIRTNGWDTPVIMVSAVGDVPIAVRAMKNGAIDFLEKPVSDQLLLDQIHRALQTDASLRETKSLLESISAHYQTLTSREQEVIRLVVKGLSSKEVAQELGVSFKTVEAHRAKIMRKMGAKSVAQLIHMALRLPDFDTE